MRAKIVDVSRLPSLIHKNCLHCDTPIQVRRVDVQAGLGKYCSVECTRQYRAAHPPPGKSPNLTCAICKKPFYRNNAHQKSQSALYFCSKGCLQKAKATGILVPRHFGTSKYRVVTCLNCKKPFEAPRSKSGGYSRVKYCGPLCSPAAGGIERLEAMTKGEAFQKYGWHAARSHINEKARHKYWRAGKMTVCSRCSYTNHVEVAHIRGIADFSDETPIREINDLSNLLALCRNHHWELDHGLLKL